MSRELSWQMLGSVPRTFHNGAWHSVGKGSASLLPFCVIYSVKNSDFTTRGSGWEAGCISAQVRHLVHTQPALFGYSPVEGTSPLSPATCRDFRRSNSQRFQCQPAWPHYCSLQMQSVIKLPDDWEHHHFLPSISGKTGICGILGGSQVGQGEEKVEKLSIFIV